MYENTNELKHYGVLGMKWGVHRRLSRLEKKATKVKNRLEKNNGEGAIKAQNRIDKMTTKMLNTKREKRMLERINSINSQSATVKNGKNYANDFFSTEYTSASKSAVYASSTAELQ